MNLYLYIGHMNRSRSHAGQALLNYFKLVRFFCDTLYIYYMYIRNCYNIESVICKLVRFFQSESDLLRSTLKLKIHRVLRLVAWPMLVYCAILSWKYFCMLFSRSAGSEGIPLTTVVTFSGSHCSCVLTSAQCSVPWVPRQMTGTW